MSKNTVQSIEDINELAARYGMPLERMRFFIGVNNTEPKCFGIYQDDAGYWVVYKNKANGEKAIRYRGRDEAEACQIIWDKIEDEIRQRKKDADWWQHQHDLATDSEYAAEYEREMEKRVLRPNYGTRKKKKKASPMTIAVTTAAIVTLLAGSLGVFSSASHPHTGYYTHNDDLFYYQYPSWYIWDVYSESWDTYDYDAYYDNNWHDWNYDGSYYVYDGEGDNYYSFQSSDYYQQSSGSSGSYDSDYDSDWSSDWDSSWDSDSDYDYDFSDWDSGSTDWDSDW